MLLHVYIKKELRCVWSKKECADDSVESNEFSVLREN